MPQIPKPLADLTADDIAQLVNDEWQEDDQLEFKRDLPAREGGRSDPWYAAQKELGDRARNELIEEVIGFANAYSGDVIIGVGEVGELPARAGNLNPLPSCVDLAHRLELAARDCIEAEQLIHEKAIAAFFYPSKNLARIKYQDPASAHETRVAIKRCHTRYAS